MPTTTKNPLYQTVEATWECLAADTNFAALVPAMNRIDYTKDARTVDKPGLHTADLPQVRVLISGLEGQIFRTSNSCSVQVYLSIEVKVGDKRLENLTEVSWAIYCAMSRWETYLRDTITWQGQNVFKKLYPMKVETEYSPKSKEKDPAGWVEVWAAAGDLFVTTSAIQAFGTT